MRTLIQHIRQSLSLKLSLSILLMAVPIFVLSLGILFLQSRWHIKVEAMERTASVLNAVTQRVNRYLMTIETATNANDWLVAENLNPESFLEYSRRIVALNANVNGCSITGEPYLFPQYGRYFSAYSVREGDSIITVREGEYEYFDKEWYKKPCKLGRACWVDPFDDFNEGTLSASDMIASYCKPLYDGNGKFIGIIATDLSLPRLAETIQAERPTPNSYFMLLGEDGHYFVHPDSTLLVNHTIFSGVDAHRQPDVIALGHEMTTGKQGTMRVNFGNAPCMVSYQPIAGTQWSLALVCPEKDILQAYNKLTAVLIPLIVIGLLFILMLCRRIVAHAISPLNRLVEQSQRLAEGRYDERIAHTDRHDAVGRLQNSFAIMQKSLNRHVSAIKKVNEETEQRNEELRQASLLAEEADRQKAVFIQNMTHQIRTPLNIVGGFAQVMGESITQLPDEELKNIKGMMRHNAMLLNRMVLMLYDSSDTGVTEELNCQQREEVPCNDVARECIDNTSHNFPGLSIVFSTSLPDSVCMLTNRLYLMRSLREILYNSAKYSDGQHVSLSISQTDTTIRFVFQDTGPGIGEEIRERMFEPFGKVDDLSEGLGLGLPLTKRHVDNLGGSMTLDTGYREGCRIIIELPR